MASIYIARDNTRLGSFSEDEVRAGLQSGRFFPTDLGWREGMENWQPLSEFSEFAAPADGVPPPPPPFPSFPAGPPVSAMGAIAPAERNGPPWEQRETLGFWNAFIETFKGVLFAPEATFAAMKREGGIGAPLGYGVLGG